MGKHGLSATEIGGQFGATARVGYRILELAGIVEGGPGAWRPTAKGEQYFRQVSFNNGYGGRAYRQWDSTYFDPKILDDISVTPEIVAQARELDLAHRAVKKLAKVAQKEEAEAWFETFQKQEADKLAAQVAHGQINWKNVAILTVGAVVVAGTAVAVIKWGPDLRRALKEKMAANGAVAATPDIEAEGREELDDPDQHD